MNSWLANHIGLLGARESFLVDAGMVAVDKATFLRAIAARDGVRDAQRQEYDDVGDVATPYRMRGGTDLGRTIESPRRPFSQPARYFLRSEFAPC